MTEWHDASKYDYEIDGHKMLWVGVLGMKTGYPVFGYRHDGEWLLMYSDEPVLAGTVGYSVTHFADMPQGPHESQHTGESGNTTND